MREFQLNFNGHSRSCSPQKPLLMGILNITPDSFYDGGRYRDFDRAVHRGIQMEEEGADIIDIGGQSTRPGSEPVSIAEEKERVLPVIRELSKRAKIPLSIDTYKAEVAEIALQEGATVVNDISALRFDSRMVQVLRDSKALLCLMHMQGEPRNMQQNPHYDDVVGEVLDFLKERVEFARSNGIETERLLIDPGIGFGKTVQHNLELIHNLARLADLELPVVLGTSRKSFIGKVLNLAPEERLEGTLASCLFGLSRGACIFRVHDVAPVRRAMRVWKAMGHPDSF